MTVSSPEAPASPTVMASSFLYVASLDEAPASACASARVRKYMKE